MHGYNTKYCINHEELLKVTGSEETAKVVITVKQCKITTMLLRPLIGSDTWRRD